jgi:Streptomyces sporulation and cell division protein, SsgA
MMNRDGNVAAVIHLHQVIQDGTLIPLTAWMAYRASDPYAVHMDFRLSDGEPPVQWMFGRDLLVAGLESMAGEGDVKIWPSDAWEDAPVTAHQVFGLRVSSPLGEATFAVPTEGVDTFLAQSFVVVPPGSETRYCGDPDFELKELGRGMMLPPDVL